MGYEDARVSRRICPEALQRKTSICPGVSTMMYLESAFCCHKMTIRREDGERIDRETWKVLMFRGPFLYYPKNLINFRRK